MSMDLEAALAGLLESCDLDTYIQECGEKSPKSGGPFLKILFPRFSEDAPDIQAFAEFLWLQAINYVIPLRLRKQAKDEIAASSTGGNLSAASRLMQRTRKTFLEFNQKFPHRASEVGELLAYLIALRYLEAVQIASKMALKTNSNMPVYGLDGIHARFSGGVMTLYFLESKLAKTAASGFGDYVSSTGKFGANRKQYLLEYEIISNLSNLDALSQSDRDLALEYLDVYGAQKSQRVERSVGIICYTDEQLYSEKLPKNDNLPPAAHESALANRLADHYPKLRELAAKGLAAEKIDLSTCKLFFVAFPDVDKLRTKFYEVMANA